MIKQSGKYYYYFPPSPIDNLFTRLSWTDFWTVFYVVIYSFLESNGHTKTLQNPTLIMQYSSMKKYMSMTLKRNKVWKHFYRGMAWFITDQKEYNIFHYNEFLEQIERGIVQFKRYYSGSFDEKIALRHIDNIPQKLERMKEWGLCPTDMPPAPCRYKAAFVEFDGLCTPINRIGRDFFGEDECVIDPDDTWIVEKAECDRTIKIGLNICDFWFIHLRQAQ